MEIQTKAVLRSATPTISVSPAYSSGDQVGGLMTLQDAVDELHGTGVLMSLIVIDKAKVDLALNVLFFNDIPIIASSDNAALNISDSEMASKCIGSVSVSTYVDLSANSMATAGASSCGILLQAIPGSRNIYAIMQASAAAGGAFSSTTDLTLKFGIPQD